MERENLRLISQWTKIPLVQLDMAISCDERGRRMSSWESDAQKKTPIPFLIPIGIHWVSSVSIIWFLLLFK